MTFQVAELIGVVRGPLVRVARRAAFAVLAALWAGFSPAPGEAKVFSPQSFTLANGLQVVVIENHRLPVVRQTVFYRVGAADDPPGKSGVAHFLEHLMFKGTKTIAPSQFSKIVARNGGRENAFTSADVTAYYQTVSRDRLELMMKIESDRMANLLITAKQAASELQVVIEERRMRVENRPEAQLDEHVSAALFLNHPYRIPIIGWQHEVETLTVDDAIAFYKRHYAPNNAILVIAGDITVDEARPLVEKYYGVIPANPRIRPRQRLREPPHRAARRVVMHSDRVRDPHFARDYLAPSATTGETKHARALEVLSDVLGGGASSRLYSSLVLGKKVALGVSVRYEGDVFGPATFTMVARPRDGVDVGAVEAALDEQIRALLKDGITEDELNNTKKRMLAGAVFARDSLSRGAISVGIALAIGEPLADVENWPEHIKAVTREQVLAAARHVLRPERSVTSMLLPEKAGAASDGDARREPPRTSRSAKERTQ